MHAWDCGRELKREFVQDGTSTTSRSSCCQLPYALIFSLLQPLLHYQYHRSSFASTVRIRRVTTPVTVPTGYKANLNQLLLPLSFHANTVVDNGFYSSSYGENPDKVNAIALCRGDLNPDVCRNCLNASKYFLPTQLCPNQKEAIALYDECFLRYSSRTIFSSIENTPEFVWTNVYNILDDAKVEFHGQLLRLFQGLTDRAAAGGSLSKFAVGHTPAPRFQTIHALVQCTPDLSQQDCKYCLSGALQIL